jgi:hypothetical protein
MSKTEQLHAFPLLPVFYQGMPNGSIDLGATSVILGKDATEPSVIADARMVFTTHDRLEILVQNASGKPSLQRFFESINDGTKLIFAESGEAVSAMFNGTDDSIDIYHPLKSPVQVVRKQVLTKKTFFHLVNWPKFSGPEDFMLMTGTQPRQGFRRCGRLSLKVNGWSLKIVEVETLKPLMEELKTKGGYVITHAGLIEKEHGASYSADDLEELLSMLHCFFSFVLARWAGPQLQVGYDEIGDKSFENWGYGPLTSGAWLGHVSWFDERHSELIQQVLTGFYDLWKKEIWKTALHEVIYWYVGANQIGSGVNVDSALLFTQSALECLAWTYCVLDRGMVSKDAFRSRGLRTSDKLRMLISSLGLPMAMPTEVKSLHFKPKKGKAWIDAMDALTDLRNGLVHPDKDHAPPDDAYYDAWRMSLWYIDLILLRLCNHEGMYANRLSTRYTGQVELVPWGKKVSSTEFSWPIPNDYY